MKNLRASVEVSGNNNISHSFIRVYDDSRGTIKITTVPEESVAGLLKMGYELTGNKTAKGFSNVRYHYELRYNSPLVVGVFRVYNRRQKEAVIRAAKNGNLLPVQSFRD